MTTRRTKTADVIEDARFLATDGVGLTETAHRTGTTPVALEKLLRDHHELPLLHQLRAHEPIATSYLEGRIDARVRVQPAPIPLRGTWKVA